MGRRGDDLREHMLWSAKEVFLEMGFERASMDVIAARAQTSKRTLYAHFESKEKLYLAVIELVRELFSARLLPPGEYSTDPEEALVEFCGRFLQGALYSATIRMCRVSIAEAERFPEAAHLWFDVGFNIAHERLGAFLQVTYALTASESAEAAEELIGLCLHPRFVRALFGVDPLSEHDMMGGIPPEIDLKPVRKAVKRLVASISQ